MVEDIKHFRQKDGIDTLKVYCVPTQNYPDGKNWFYAPANALEIIDRYSWCIYKYNKGSCASATVNGCSMSFHRMLAEFYLGYFPECIDHINGIDIDNVDSNLNSTSYQENARNSIKRGYFYNYLERNDKYVFRPQVIIFKKAKFNGCYYREDEVCLAQYHFEEQEYPYRYNIFKDRRGYMDILDMERTGIVSEEESIYRRILSISENAWYLYRYNLFSYFKENHISTPSYALDEYGFMTHNITGKRLCPL